LRHDRGAGRVHFGLADLVFASTGRTPQGCGRVGSVLAGPLGRQFDFVGDHERRIESDAELADQFGPLLDFLFAEALEKALGAGIGDGADVGLDLVCRHADAVVGDGDRAGGLVDEQGHAPALGGFADRLEENLAVRIQRVDHQIHQLLHFSLKFAFFGTHARVESKRRRKSKPYGCLRLVRGRE